MLLVSCTLGMLRESFAFLVLTSWFFRMLFASLASGLAMIFNGVVDVYSQGLAALLIRSEMSAEDLALPKAC